jgi:hypothetical protein
VFAIFRLHVVILLVNSMFSCTCIPVYKFSLRSFLFYIQATKPLTMVRSTAAKAKMTTKPIERHRSKTGPAGLPKKSVAHSNRTQCAIVSNRAVPAPPPPAPVVLSTPHPRLHPSDSSEEESIDLETSQNRYVFAILSNVIFCPQL